MSAHLAAPEAGQFAKLSRGVRLTVEFWSEERLRPCGPASPQQASAVSPRSAIILANGKDVLINQIVTSTPLSNDLPETCQTPARTQWSDPLK